MERGAKIRRSEVVGHYCENSRAILESLRAYALKHHQGFTIDTEIQPGTGGRRWIRVIAAPVVEDGRAIRLHGLKFAL